MVITTGEMYFWCGVFVLLLTGIAAIGTAFRLSYKKQQLTKSIELEYQQ